MATQTTIKPPIVQQPSHHPWARAVSIILHPIVLPLVTLLALAYLAWGGTLARLDVAALTDAIYLALAAAVITAVPVAMLVVTQVLRGRWTDTDVSVRRQRYLLYPFGIACMLATAGAFVVAGAPLVTVRAALGLAAMNVANGLINFKYKVSAHAATASLCATLLWLAAPLRDPTILAGPMTAAALLVGWSRVTLGRHTRGQVIVGWGVGVASGLAAALLPWPLGLAPMP
jgi:membrane-associated phospholipid phosphatase